MLCRSYYITVACSFLATGGLCAAHSEAGTCMEESASSSLHHGTFNLCETGMTYFSMNPEYRAGDSSSNRQGCCHRPEVLVDAESQVIDYLVRRRGGNCDVLGTCHLLNSVGIPGFLSKYDSSRAPADDDTFPGNLTTGTHIAVSVMFTNVGDPDTKTKKIPVEMHFKLAWNDPRLRWNSTNYSHTEIPNGVTHIAGVDPELIWKPDFFFSRMRLEDEKTRQALELDTTGNVYWVLALPQGTKLQCTFKLFWFPFETAVCWTDVQSYGYSGKVVQFRAGKLHGGGAALEGLEGKDAGAYDITGSDFFNAQILDKMGDWRLNRYAKLPTVVFAIYLKRRQLNSLYDFVLRPFLTTTLSILAGFIDPSAVPARMGALTVLLLVQFNTISTVSASLPPTSFTVLEVYLLICIVIMCLNLLEFALVHFSINALRKWKVKVDKAATQSTAHVIEESMIGSGIDLEYLHLGLSRIRTQDDWDECIDIFRNDFTYFYGGDLLRAFREEMSTHELMKIQSMFKKKGIEWSHPSGHGSADDVHEGAINIEELRTAEQHPREQHKGLEAREKIKEVNRVMSSVAQEMANVEKISRKHAGDFKTKYTVCYGAEWNKFVTAAESDGFTVTDLVLLNSEATISLAHHYGIIDPISTSKLIIQRENVKNDIGLEVANHSKMIVIEKCEKKYLQITIFGCIVLREHTPSKIEHYYRVSAGIFFLLTTLVWMMISMHASPEGHSERYCDGEQHGCWQSL